MNVQEIDVLYFDFKIDLAPLCRRKVQTMQDYMQYFLRAP